MSSIHQFFVVFILCAFVALPAFAQENNTVPRFVPVGSWNVEKTAFAQTRGIAGVSLPCMMANSYDNGYVLRFSGAQGNILAMAIDFRQDAFYKGRKYDVTLSLNQAPAQNLSAVAFSESTLIFNMRGINGFYQGLQNAATLQMNIEGNAMMFDLGNVAQSLGALESCFGPVKQGTTQISKSPNIQWGDKPSEQAENTPPNTPEMPSAAPTMMWEAKAGDDLQLTLQKWANRAGIPMQWQSDRSAQVASDVSLSGSFENAVQQLMAQNAAAIGLDANLGGQNLTPDAPVSRDTISRAPQQITPKSAREMTPAKSDARWVAPAGADLQLVLKDWADRAGVELVWQSHVPFQVKQAVKDSGSYESALQSLLNQFRDDVLRPAAQLNNDPVSGQKMLFVQSSRVL